MDILKILKKIGILTISNEDLRDYRNAKAIVKKYGKVKTIKAETNLNLVRGTDWDLDPRNTDHTFQ